MDQNRAIGYKNKLLAYLSADLKHFKELTTGHFVIQGRKTYESIGKPLPNRTNIILSRDTKYNPHPAVHVYNSVEDILWEYENYAEKEIDMFIIGGSQIYEQFLPHADKLYLTIIEHKFDKSEVDSYFPAFELSDWNHRVTGFKRKDDKNEYSHYYVEYLRK